MKNLSLTVFFLLSFVFNLLAQTTCGSFTKVFASQAGFYTVGLKTDGTLWSCGQNSFSQLGVGNSTGQTSFTAVTGGYTWLSAAPGNQHVMAIRSDGTLWGWGTNAFGQLGNGTTNTVTNPVQASTDTWIMVACGSAFSVAIKSDGTLWFCGQNTNGQKGDGTTSSTAVNSTLTQIGTDNTWVKISCGAGHVLAIKADGTLWGWGLNNTKQINSGGTPITSPVQIGSATDWATVSGGSGHSFAMKTDGSLYGWGANSVGQIGDNTTTNPITTQTLIGAAGEWADIFCGSNHNIALKKNGTLWSWGFNTSGQLGDGTTTSPKRAPGQIGSSTNWYSIGGGSTHSFAVSTDGTLWSWGVNAQGQLGLGNTASPKTSPQLISSNDLLPLGNNISQTLLVPNSTTTFFNAATCGDLIAMVRPTGASPVSGSVTAKTWSGTTMPSDVVQRHYEITPATNAANATGKITLFFLQTDFDDYNNVSTNLLKLPTGPLDVTGIGQLIIRKYSGVSSDGSGDPSTYTGSLTRINPNDADIIWNATTSRWEVSFSVSGFSGFFVEANESTLPLQFLSFTTQKCNSNQVCLNWKTAYEENVSHFEVERSENNKDFVKIVQVAANNNIQNDYKATDNNLANTEKVFYRIKQIDKDGKFSYSNIASVNFIDKNILVLPTVFKGAFTVQNNYSENGMLQLTAIDGKKLKQQALSPGINRIETGNTVTGIIIYHIFIGGKEICQGKLIAQ